MTVVAVLGAGWGVPAFALRTAGLPPVPAAARGAGTPVVVDPVGALAREVEASLAPAAWPRLDVSLETIGRAGAPEWLTDRCDNVNAGNLRRCRYGDPAAPRTAVLVGDSMAVSWLPALRAVLDPDEWSIQVLTRNQCPLPRLRLWRERPSEPFVECDEHKAWAFDHVRVLAPDLVVASHSLTFLDHQRGEPVGRARFPPWERGLRASLADLSRAAGRVVLLGPPPRSGNLQSCVTRLSEPADCTTTVPRDWVQLRATERAAARAAGADYLDVEPLFCRSGRCPAVVGSTPVYSDGRHLTAAYARHLAPALGVLLDAPSARSRS